ncbi:MAG: toprim domain-containing protein [Urechidicola sp.]|nr:toprim domain-containing protein [Urechidicola sp.]
MITKENILKRTDGGLLYFLLIYKLHGISLRRIGNKFANTHNLFYFDSNPSLSIYFNEKYNRWYFKDHGTNSSGIEYGGDIFDFARLYHKLEIGQFFKLLHLMDIDIKMSKDLPQISKTANHTYIKVEAKSLKYELLIKKQTDECIQYFEQFNINLNHYSNVNQITGIRFLNEDYSINYTKMLPHSGIHIAYDFVTYAKIYSINPKAFRFVGNKRNTEYTFGGFDYADYLNEPLFLTGGEKDVMTLHSLGYNAFCLLSETSTRLSRILRKGMYESGHNTIVLYDTDKTGRYSATKLHNKYNFSIADLDIIIPEEYKDVVTDISDYVKLKLDKTKLVNFLNSFIPKEKLKMENGLLLDEEIYNS